ncbi:MAG TPA: hypothetical protein VK892_09525 [Pyrinomonadaceae bacterium]|nr:hypothetical protein [Pyrinomonadaceae bacterium]
MNNTVTLDNYTQVKCAWCGGTGKWNVAPGKASCIVCGGKGQVLVTGQASQCRKCRGSGKSNGVSPCFTCVGIGWEKDLGQ